MPYLDAADILGPLASKAIPGPMLVHNFQRRPDGRMLEQTPREIHKTPRMRSRGLNDGRRGSQVVFHLQRSRRSGQITRPRGTPPKHSRICARMRRKSPGRLNLLLLHHRDNLHAPNLRGSEPKPRLAPKSPDTILARPCRVTSLPCRVGIIRVPSVETYLCLHLKDLGQTRWLIL